MLRAIIFNVERGFCAFVRSPQNYALLIDCGSSNDFSPIKYIVDNEIQFVKEIEGYKLAHFICTHPHEDHISDVERLSKLLKPKTITGWKFDDWNDVKDPNVTDKNAYANLDTYGKIRDSYTSPPTPIDWGMEIKTDGLSVSDAKKINEDSRSFINNSSIVTMLLYNNWKFFFSGDLMNDGWEELLKRDDFNNSLKGTGFFIVSHHGLESGYNSKIYDVMGKPWINIVSEKSGQKVYSAYSDDEHSKGIDFDGETRRMLSTKKGSIFIEVSDEGKANIYTKILENNIM